MLSTIAFVTIFSAILVFFVDEIMAYIKKLVARPYVFLVFSMMLGSALLEMYEQKLLWLLITLWIVLLQVVQWLSGHMFFLPFADALAKMMVVMTLSIAPVAVGLLLEKKHKRRYFNAEQKSNYGYIVGLFFWVIVILLLALGPVGSDFSG